MSERLQVRNVDLITLDGRALVRDLSVSLGDEQVALVGRNGVGKSTLLRVLAGLEDPARGEVRRDGSMRFVAQNLSGPASGGELRRRALQEAFDAEPDLLLLDEPSNDLDSDGLKWLCWKLRGWKRGLIVVSHDPAVLACFSDFFSIAERGCQHLSGGWKAASATLQAQATEHQASFVSGLGALVRQEEAHHKVSRRRARKKAVGRLHELDRCQSKARLNTRRGAAQVSQAKVRLRQERTIGARRAWAQSLRRALAVELPLSRVVPEVPPGPRLGVVGPNGSGKTTWLQSQLQEGDGHIDQGATNWMLPESVFTVLSRTLTVDEVAQHLVAHRFPLGLAQRPLSTLSAGERTRAALLCLFQRPITRLVLDEPTWSLDQVGVGAMAEVLVSWQGGLLVASHDRAFLDVLQLQGIRQVG